jgi:acyl-CoA thioesterase I
MVKEPLRFFFFGDSICFGQGVSIHSGWVPRISARLEAMGADMGREVTVINASVNGNTTRQALERMPYDVQSHGVQVLLVQFGLNDCNYWQTDAGLPRVSPAAFAANLQEIIARGVRFGARRVFLNTNHPTGRDHVTMPGAGVSYEASNRRYNAIIREVGAGAEGRVIVNDVEVAFAEYARGDRARLEGLLLPDGLHLSKRGHDLYFDFLYPRIEGVMKVLLGEG